MHLSIVRDAGARASAPRRTESIMTNETWCIAGGENGADRRLADALLRGGSTVAIVGRDVAPFALLVDHYADAIMPVELTATTPQALAELRESIELNLGEV